MSGNGGSDGNDGGDDDDLFRRAMRDAVPLDPRKKRRVRLPGGQPKARRKITVRPPSFAVEVEGELVLGRAPGVSRKQLSDLRAGQLPIEGTVDLHRLTAAAAIDLLRGRVLAAARDGKRCLLVIHGRGLHSEGAPVLREAAIRCLTAAPCKDVVRGFCTALPRDGGPGAMYVNLR